MRLTQMFCLSLMDRYMLIVHTLKYLIIEQPLLLFLFLSFCPPSSHFFIYKRKVCPLFTFFHVISKKKPTCSFNICTSCLFIRMFNALLKAFATNSFGKRWVEARKWKTTYLPRCILYLAMGLKKFWSCIWSHLIT